MNTRNQRSFRSSAGGFSATPSIPARRWAAVLGLALTLIALVAGSASADVLREGTWPDEALVDLDVEGMPRAQAIRRLADAAGWSLVAEGLDDVPVHVSVKQQPPTKVLDLLLAEGRYVARRDGALVALSKRAEPPSAADAPTAPPAGSTVPIRVVDAPPAAASTDDASRPPTKKGEDRIITGDDVRIANDEVVHDLIVWGGEVVLEGTVTGDLLVMGGSVTLVEGAYVAGDLVALGATLDVANGAQVDGEVGVIGGSLRRGDQVQVNCTTCDDEPEEPVDYLGKFLGKVLGNLTGMALLWVFGAILLALSLGRVEVMQKEIEARPWRCLAMGMASVIAVLVIVGSLVVTLIGIPLAVIGALFAGFAAYVGFCVVVLTTGAVLGRRRTDNAYVHLAVGCGVYFLVGLIPVVGGLASTAIALMGLGALVATRGAGLLPPRKPETRDAPPPPAAPPLDPGLTGA